MYVAWHCRSRMINLLEWIPYFLPLSNPQSCLVPILEQHVRTETLVFAEQCFCCRTRGKYSKEEGCGKGAEMRRVMGRKAGNGWLSSTPGQTCSAPSSLLPVLLVPLVP